MDWGGALPANGDFFLRHGKYSKIDSGGRCTTAHILKVIKRVHFKWALAGNPSTRRELRQKDYEFKVSLGHILQKPK